MKISNFFSNIYVKNLLGALAICVTLSFIVLAWLNIYTRHGKESIVPDVKGMQVGEIAPFFKQANLDYVLIDSVYVKNKPPGSIIETVPPVGTRVKEGRVIYLTVNSGTAYLLIVPSVKDMSQRQAVARLTALGFESVRVQTVPGAYLDLVVGLESGGRALSSGERLPADTPLTLLVSSGSGEVLPGDSTMPVPEKIIPEETVSEEESWF